MNDWETWLVIGLLALSTTATRSAFLLIGHLVTLPRRVGHMLRYAPACALAGIAGPDLLLGQGGPLPLALANPRLLAAVAALGFYLLRRNMLQTIAVGMLVFTLLRVSHVFGAAG